MGIRGLLTVIKNDSTLQVVDLVEEAIAAGGIEILVDFEAVIRLVIQIAMDKMILDYYNDYLYFPIGVYDMLTEAIVDEAGIRLVWMADGARLDRRSELIAFSIFKGNDHTADYSRLLNYLQISTTNIRLKDHLGISIAVYDLATNDDSLTGFLARKLNYGEISRIAYSAHFGTFYHHLFNEHPTADCPPILTLLLEVRKRLYPYLLHERYDEVVEWRCRCEDHLYKVPVTHAEIKTNMIKSKPEEGDSLSERYGIDLFEEVISHLEEDGPLRLVAKYGIEKAFILHILRYMFLLTRGRNLRLTEKEFKGLFVTVLFQYSRSEGFQFGTRFRQDVFLGMKICPSERCLITGTWFMNIYMNTKYFCGATFNLTKDFPEPWKVMSGPTFYAFYENLMCETNSRLGHLPDSMLQTLGDLEKEVMAKYGQEYEVVTTGRA